MNKEVKEALDAGNRAMLSLKEAYDELQSAGGWGIFDLFGGGLFSGVIKHSKIDNARCALEKAKQDLLIFQDELDDVPLFQNVQIEIGDFLTFADFFFDGFVADMMVQSKIRDAQRQIQDVAREVDRIMKQLESKW